MVHERLKTAREAKGLSLTELAARAGVRAAVLEAIDRGAYGELPSGLYGRHAVRAYATAVGLDPHTVLDEIGPLLPEPEDPLDGLARVRGFSRASSRRPRASSRVSDAACEVPPASGEVTGAVCPADPFDWRAPAASVIDGALLTGIVLALIQLTAMAAGTGAADLIAPALPAWSLIAALIASAYFVILGGVRKATLGATLAGIPRDEHERHPVDARSAMRRGLRCALRESSILVEWLLASRQNNGWLRALTH